MRRILQTVLMVCGMAVAAHSAAAKGLLHSWPVTDPSEAGTVLEAQGSASGRGLTATVPPAVPMNGGDPAAVFDAEIDRQMDDTEIAEREDVLRLVGGKTAILFTTIEYAAGWTGKKRIAMFAAVSKAGDAALRIIRADGPFDRKLMDHYSSDVLTIARDPEAAIAGRLPRQPHRAAGKVTAPIEATKPKPAETTRKQTSSAKMPAAPEGWSRKVYTDAVSYWPTVGPLATGSKTGYLSILIFNEMPLNDRPLNAFLGDFTTGREKFYKVKRRETAVMDGPHRAWDFMRAVNKNGVALNVSFLAVRTGENSVRIVREIVTDKDHEERLTYRSAIKGLYRHIEAETAAAFQSKGSPLATMDLMTKRLLTESRSQRRARQKAVEGRVRAQKLAALASPPGKGIPPSDMTGIFLRSDFLKRAYGGKNANISVYILLKDGSAYVNPTLPPEVINITASRRIEAGKWKQWRKTGNTYQVRANDSAPWKKLKGRFAKPAPGKTMGFRGKHIAAWGDVLMGTAGHRTGSITLTQKGRYETSSFSLAGGSGITGLPAATVSSSQGKNGSQTTTMSNVVPAFINNTNRDSNGTDFTGQYALQGYTAEFLSDSGKLNRTLFLRTQDGGVYVGGRYYSRRKK